jgi:hypothetical protein
MDSYQELCCELLHALEGSPTAYRAQWSKLIARTRGRLWGDSTAQQKGIALDEVGNFE